LLSYPLKISAQTYLPIKIFESNLASTFIQVASKTFMLFSPFDRLVLMVRNYLGQLENCFWVK